MAWQGRVLAQRSRMRLPLASYPDPPTIMAAEVRVGGWRARMYVHTLAGCTPGCTRLWGARCRKGAQGGRGRGEGEGVCVCADATRHLEAETTLLGEASVPAPINDASVQQSLTPLRDERYELLGRLVHLRCHVGIDRLRRAKPSQIQSSQVEPSQEEPGRTARPDARA